MYAALAALVGLVWMFRKSGDAGQSTIPGFVSNSPASTGATGTKPLIIVTMGNGAAAADTTVSNQAPTATAGTWGNGASFGASTSAAPQTTSSEEAEAAAAHAAFLSGQPAPAGWRYTPMGPVRI